MLTTKTTITSILWPSMIALTLPLAACSDQSALKDTQSAQIDSADSMDVDSIDNIDSTDSIDTQNNISREETADALDADKISSDTTPIKTQSVEQKRIDTLSDYRWTLSAATDSNNQPMTQLNQVNEQVSLKFNQQGNRMLTYSVGCNIMSANFQLNADTLSTKDSMSTKMSCGDLDIAENLLNQLMQGDSKLTLTMNDNIETPLLTQVTANNSTLTWRGQLTTQAKYNGKGQTVFWAVAADSKPCQDNPAKMCLQVKPITYNEFGIKVKEGEYAEFAGRIDGYQHDGRHNEVLRLQRFKINNNAVLSDDVDAKFAYVLDSIIESSLVQ